VRELQLDDEAEDAVSELSVGRNSQVPIEGELNPNHPVTSRMRDQWHKILALVMLKHGLTKVTITPEDIADAAGKMNVAVGEFGGALEVWLVDDAEAVELARREGGLPV
jgi:hypothetical protein